MSEITVPFNENPSDQAVLLLAAAEELELGSAAVKTSEGSFIVPQEVYDRAFGEESKAPAKKATKRSATRKK
jgi:hypothetical protein